MLTVKHIEVTGHENIYPATRVSYQPGHRRDAGDPNEPDTVAPCVFIDTPKGDIVPLGSFGTFYVMNEAGKTVAKYELGGWGGQAPVGLSASGAVTFSMFGDQMHVA